MTVRACLLACLVPAVLAGSACDVAISAGGVEGTFERDLAVSGPLELEVGSGSGDIVVRTGKSGAVHVRGRVRAWQGAWASLGGESPSERIRRIEKDPPIEQSGNRIQIGPRRWNDGWNGLSISYEITAPATTRLTVRSGSGRLEVAELTGPVEASTGSGDIRVGRITEHVSARTGSGDITVAGASAATASTGSGSVRASGIRGDLEARSGSGDISIEQDGKGRVDVSTGSGHIDVAGATGPLRARAASGDIVLQGSPAVEWMVSASSGDVRMRVPEKAAFDLDLHSNSGRIDTSVPVTVLGQQSRRELRGQVRGGGARVKITTSSGDIVIQ